MRPTVFLLFITLFAALAGCSKAPATTPTTGGPRIVVLSPALAVTLKDLGLERLIVGRHGWDIVLDPALPACGDQAGIDYEALLKARPTHVLTEWGARPLPARLEELKQQHNWTVRNFTLLTLEQVRAATKDIADDFAPWRDNPARTTDQVLREMDQAWSRRGSGFATAGKVLLLHSASPPSVLGPGSFHHQILERIGGTPAVTTGAPFIELDTEDALALAPDAIVLISPRSRQAPPRTAPPTAEEWRLLLGPLAALDIPAVKNHRLALIDDPACNLPSTGLITFAELLARALAGWTTP